MLPCWAQAHWAGRSRKTDSQKLLTCHRKGGLCSGTWCYAACLLFCQDGKTVLPGACSGFAQMKTAFAWHEKGGMVWIKDAGILSAFGIRLLKKKKAGREAFFELCRYFRCRICIDGKILHSLRWVRRMQDLYLEVQAH